MHFNSNCHFLCSSGSVYSLCADEDEEIEPSPSGQQIIENSITMNKMKLLKAKMETMNLSKKVKLGRASRRRSLQGSRLGGLLVIVGEKSRIRYSPRVSDLTYCSINCRELMFFSVFNVMILHSE